MLKYWQHPLFLPFCVAVYYVLLTLLAGNVPFFWDNVALVSKPAWHFYQLGFSPPLVPIDIDAGHPPLYSIYLAFCWKVFEPTLVVSHWALLPFLLIIVGTFTHLAKQLELNQLVFGVMMVLISEPCFASQSILGYSDVALVCLHLLCISCLLGDNNRWLMFLLPVLSMLSLRGMLLLPGFVISHYLILAAQHKSFKKRFQILAATHIPVILVVVCWLLYHYQHTGFFTNNTVAAHWSGNYELASWHDLLRNLAVICWRMADQGRIVLLLALAALYVYARTHRTNISSNQKRFLIVVAVQFLAFLPFVAGRQTPILHRYFMAFYLLLGLALLIFAAAWGNRAKRNLVLTVVVLAMLTGHFWIYPFPVANGWDATLVSLPYFNARKEVTRYVEENGISSESIVTAFPMITGNRFTQLESENRFQFTGKDKIPLDKADYVLYSNISNDFTPAEAALLKHRFTMLHSFGSGLVQLQLYQRKTNE